MGPEAYRGSRDNSTEESREAGDVKIRHSPRYCNRGRCGTAVRPATGKLGRRRQDDPEVRTPPFVGIFGCERRTVVRFVTRVRGRVTRGDMTLRKRFMVCVLLGQ